MNDCWRAIQPDGPFRNSLILGVTSATATVAFVTLIAWIVERTKLSGRKLLDFLAFVLIAVLGIVLGISLIWLYLSFLVVDIRYALDYFIGVYDQVHADSDEDHV